jgi:hypothetical protein
MLATTKYELLPQQLPTYDNLVRQRMHYVICKQGTGKTVICTKAMYDLERKCILIICPSNAIHVWENHIKEWFDGLDVASGKDTWYHIHRVRWKQNDAQRRQREFAHFNTEPDTVNIYITTSGAFLKDASVLAQHNYDCIIVDESKRLGLTSRKSKLRQLLLPLVRNLPKGGCFWPLTGTPGFSPEHFWSVFNLFDPKTFSSYWRFVDTYCYSQITHYGREILGIKKEAREGWNMLLHAKCSQLTKEDFGHQETVRSILPVEMDASQEALYNQYRDEKFAITSDGNIDLAQTAMNVVQKYRELLICPKMIDSGASYGAAFQDFLEQLEADPHVVLFTPYTRAIPHFVQGLREAGHQNVFVLSGEEGLSPDALVSRLDRFRATQGICICSILYATAFSLEPAKAAYFIGYDYDPDNNEQAEERLNRLTTPHLVNAYYYCYAGTYDETLCTNVNVKRMKANVTLDLVP